MPDLIAYHLARLKDKNPQVRASSARELGLLGDPVALPALEALFRGDDDPQVKAAAQEAGRILFTKQADQR